MLRLQACASAGERGAQFEHAGEVEGKVVELPAQLSPPAILPGPAKTKFIEALEEAVGS